MRKRAKELISPRNSEIFGNHVRDERLTIEDHNEIYKLPGSAEILEEIQPSQQLGKALNKPIYLIDTMPQLTDDDTKENFQNDNEINAINLLDSFNKIKIEDLNIKKNDSIHKNEKSSNINQELEMFSSDTFNLVQKQEISHNKPSMGTDEKIVKNNETDNNSHKNQDLEKIKNQEDFNNSVRLFRF